MRNKITFSIASHMLPGQGEMIDTILGPQVEAVSSGACALDVETSHISVSGTKAYTLAAPTYAGQRKRIVCVAAASTPAGTLTVSSPDDTTGFVCPATFFFDNVGQTLEFIATTALKWRCIQKIRTGFKTLVLGTTVTTGICDMSHVLVSVTGSVASTASDKKLPPGAAVGELCLVSCSSATGTPHGDLGATLVDLAGAAGTSLDDFVAAKDRALLQWNGSAYQVLDIAGSALAVV